jgi:hypothetical protein
VRPMSIIAFERLSLISVIILGILNICVQYNRIIKYVSVNELSFLILFTFVLQATLILLVSRKRNIIAKWILITLFLLSLPRYVNDIGSIDFNLPILTHGIQLIQSAMQAIALGLLFTPSADHGSLTELGQFGSYLQNLKWLQV